MTLFVGGVARLDVEDFPGSTLYLTVWASDLIPLHMGKTATAHERFVRFVGNKLYPPSGPDDAVQAMGPLVPMQARPELTPCRAPHAIKSR